MVNNRILSVALSNIKNVESGYAEFSEKKDIENGILDGVSDGVLGFYGPNGSGKTTIVDAFEILKDFSLHRPVYSFEDSSLSKRVLGKFDYYLTLGKTSGSVEYEFLINYENHPYKVRYSFELIRQDDLVLIAGEHLLVFRYFPESKTPFKYPFAPIDVDYRNDSFLTLYDGVKHNEGKIFSFPVQGTHEFEAMLRLSAEKTFCSRSGTSFLFSEENINYLQSHKKPDVRIVGGVLRALSSQLKYRLFVSSDKLAAGSNLGKSALFGIFFDPEDGQEVHGLFSRADEPFFIDKKLLSGYEQMVKEINTFISSFVPGFQLCLDVHQKEIREGETTKIEIDIYRLIGDNRLPLSQESAGLKQLVNLSMAFVYAYGEPSAWLVVDELDAGVFETLWADIVETQSREGKGQIIFTAHNLAPLERIAPSSIVFATNNPQKRYISFKGSVKKSNNLRLLYVRALRLGWRGEDLSNGFEQQDIGAALWDAYRAIDKLRLKNKEA